MVWIAGGLSKGQDFAELINKNLKKIKAVVLLGKDKDLIFNTIKSIAPNMPIKLIERSDDEAMLEVVQAAKLFATSGDTVLLAPGCASWDMFKDYKARGNAFIDAVNKIKDQN